MQAFLLTLRGGQELRLVALFVCRHEERIARLTERLSEAEKEHEESRRTLQKEFEEEKRRLENALHKRELESQHLEDSRRALQTQLEEQQRKASSLQKELFDLQQRQLRSSLKSDRAIQTIGGVSAVETQTEALVLQFVEDVQRSVKTESATSSPSSASQSAAPLRGVSADEEALQRLIKRANSRLLTASPVISQRESSKNSEGTTETRRFSFKLRSSSQEGDSPRGSSASSRQGGATESRRSLCEETSIVGSETATSPETLAVRVKSLTERALTRRYKFQEEDRPSVAKEERLSSMVSDANSSPQSFQSPASALAASASRLASMKLRAGKEKLPLAEALHPRPLKTQRSDSQPRLSLSQKQSLLEQLAKNNEQIRIDTKMRSRRKEEPSESAKPTPDSLQVSVPTPPLLCAT